MANLYSSQRFHVSACSKTATAAVMQARAHRLEEETSIPLEILKTLESDTVKHQLILGSTTGLMSGFLAKAEGRGWAIALGIGVIAFRLIAHVRNRSGPSAFCGLGPEDMNLLEKGVDEIVRLINRNLFFAAGYLGGFLAAYEVRWSSDG